MSLAGLNQVLARAESLKSALEHARVSTDISVPAGLTPALIAGALSARTAGGLAPAVLVITATGREAESMGGSLAAYLPDAEVLNFPAWETLPHERLSPSAQIVGERLETLGRMRTWAGERPLVVVASVRAALQPLSDNVATLEPFELIKGARGFDLGEIATKLVEFAYARVDLVSRRGEFAVRGGILDVFPPTAEHPVRVDFFGDEVDEIRAFSVADQRSLPGEIDRVPLTASRELLLTPSVRQRAREARDEFPNLSGMLEKLAEGIPVEGMESLTPMLVDRLVPLTAFLPASALVAVVAPERIATRAQHLAETNREFLQAAWSAATAGAAAPIDFTAGDFLTVNELRSAALAEPARAWWTISEFDSGADAATEVTHGDTFAGYLRVAATPVPAFAGNVEGAITHIAARLADDWRVIVLAAGHGRLERARDVLADAGIGARIVEVVPSDLEANVVYLAQADQALGFELPDAKLSVFGETDFYGRAAAYQSGGNKPLASKRRNVVDPLQLKPGDHVVHSTHGIGRFVEMIQREVATGTRPKGPQRSGMQAQPKAMREYLVIEYAASKRGQAGDRLFVPMDQLDLLSRYVGGETPTLSKMGGSDWAAAKGRARKAVRDIAVELVKLYSARMSAKGHAFGPDTPWQGELEAAFPYAETRDQLQTIDEVKADMERPIPMDRLLAGDVGFGKTEVAVRAAFKAIQDGKQVAMLVPTTLLVKQHVQTFADRFAGFPVHVRALSRFQTDKEARETKAGLADGTIDLVIGTHRILTEGMVFKDLGLMIVDEEQRFGVEHKDALKKLKTNVDILSMSATPIPRTLEMAVTGIREMSTLATAPEERHPILTFVGAYSDQQVAAAIRRELLREGQVFFVHNRVASINRVAAQLAELVPEARIAVAHGQLSETVLEQIVVDFWERKFDVLVCTTIIETGLDIQNANTIIIDRADKYGLSQLHQLRGRVGRGRERAYAYFLYDPEKPLSETAHDRLTTIAANNELGGGMQIALKDLEIRGAGNLLGAEQAGHIAGVGFDLYLRMIGEAVATFRGDVAEGQNELRLELPVDASIPDDYIASERLRLEAYQKLSAAAAPASAEGSIDLVVEELTDRYGDLPERVERLIEIARLRRLAQQAGLSDLVAVGSNLRVTPVDIPDSRRVRLQRMHPGAKLITAQNVALIPLPEVNGAPLADADLIEWATTLVKAIFLPDAPVQAPAEEPGRWLEGG